MSVSELTAPAVSDLPAIYDRARLTHHYLARAFLFRRQPIIAEQSQVNRASFAWRTRCYRTP